MYHASSARSPSQQRADVDDDASGAAARCGCDAARPTTPPDPLRVRRIVDEALARARGQCNGDEEGKCDSTMNATMCMRSRACDADGASDEPTRHGTARYSDVPCAVRWSRHLRHCSSSRRAWTDLLLAFVVVAIAMYVACTAYMTCKSTTTVDTALSLRSMTATTAKSAASRRSLAVHLFGDVDALYTKHTTDRLTDLAGTFLVFCFAIYFTVAGYLFYREYALQS